MNNQGNTEPSPLREGVETSWQGPSDIRGLRYSPDYKPGSKCSWGSENCSGKHNLEVVRSNRTPATILLRRDTCVLGFEGIDETGAPWRYYSKGLLFFN